MYITHFPKKGDTKVKPVKTKLRYRFHDLRHYHASLMQADGIPDKYAMERMGHSCTNMLKNVYQHTFPETQKRFSQQIYNSFSASLSQANKLMEQHAE